MWIVVSGQKDLRRFNGLFSVVKDGDLRRRQNGLENEVGDAAGQADGDLQKKETGELTSCAAVGDTEEGGIGIEGEHTSP